MERDWMLSVRQAPNILAGLGICNNRKCYVLGCLKFPTLSCCSGARREREGTSMDYNHIPVSTLSLPHTIFLVFSLVCFFESEMRGSIRLCYHLIRQVSRY